jgi:PPOX class probable F420-dependent enzyme
VKTAEFVTIPETHRDLLDKAAIAHLATVDSDGLPHRGAMWYGWDGEHLLFSTLKSGQEYRNLRTNPCLVVSIVDPDSPHRLLLVGGTVLLEEEPRGDVIGALVRKYMGEAVSQWDEPGVERVTLRLKVLRVSCVG